MNWNQPYPSRRSPVMASNMVSTSQPLATQAGLTMLTAGGNAVDAAIAAAITLTVVEPCSNGIGSDAFAIIHDSENMHGLNASGRAPAAWSPGYFTRRHGRIPETGWDSVTVPGAVSAWVELSRRFGKLGFETLFEPAIRYATEGYAVTPVVARAWHKGVDELGELDDFRRDFLPGGRSPRAGELFVLDGQARTLAEIAGSGGESFYRGALAGKMVAHSNACGGVLNLDDLGNHRPDWVDCIGLDYCGHRIHQIPPNGQGVATLIALGIFERLLEREPELDSTAWHHLQIEAMKLGFNDTHRAVSDPDTMQESVAALLDPARLDELAASVSNDRAMAPPPDLVRGGTVYLAAADSSGLMVSYIQSNYHGFGSGVVVPGTGISLQNRGAGFTLTEGHPNLVNGGKRPFHTIIPGFVTRDGGPLAAFGVMGAHMQPQGHLQTLSRVINCGQNPQAALDAPRWQITAEDGLLALEDPIESLHGASLAAMGHPLATPQSEASFGGGQHIWKADGYYVAGSDWRKDGHAGGY